MTASAALKIEPAVAQSGARLLISTLERLGVEVVFGYPGGAIMPVYDALAGSGLKHILVRHERAPPSPPTPMRGPAAVSACAWRRQVPARPIW